MTIYRKMTTPRAHTHKALPYIPAAPFSFLLDEEELEEDEEASVEKNNCKRYSLDKWHKSKKENRERENTW